MSHLISHGTSQKNLGMFSPLLLEAPSQAWPVRDMGGSPVGLIWGVPKGWTAEFWDSPNSIAEGIKKQDTLWNFPWIVRTSLKFPFTILLQELGTLKVTGGYQLGWSSWYVGFHIPHDAWLVAERWTSVPYLEIDGVSGGCRMCTSSWSYMNMAKM